MARARTPTPVDDPTTTTVDESQAPYVDEYAPAAGIRMICRVCGFAHTPERWQEKWDATPDSVEYVPCDQCGRTPVTEEGDPKYIWPAELPKEAPVLKRDWDPDVMVCNNCGHKHLPVEWASLWLNRPVGSTEKPRCANCGSLDVVGAATVTPPPTP